MARLLLIEDAEDLAEIILRSLEAEGYDLRHTISGEDGLSLHEKDPFDLIILDWMLPGIDGVEVLRRLRRVYSTPVLMLTARSEEMDRVIGLEVGADDYLTKPFGMRELIARVRALLRRVEMIARQLEADRETPLAILRWGEIEIDPDSHQVKIGESIVEMTPTEFKLLQLFLLNPGRAFSRAYLLDAVWGESLVEGDRSVDSAILRLRKKLGGLGDALETVWGVGYRLRREP